MSLGVYFFITRCCSYKLLDMFRATRSPSSGADDCRCNSCVLLCRGCVGGQVRLAASVSIQRFVAQLVLQTSEWIHLQPAGPDHLHNHGTTTHTSYTYNRPLLKMDS